MAPPGALFACARSCRCAFGCLMPGYVPRHPPCRTPFAVSCKERMSPKQASGRGGRRSASRHLRATKADLCLIRNAREQ